MNSGNFILHHAYHIAYGFNVFQRIFVESQAKRIEMVRQKYKMGGRPLLTVEKHLERITVGQLVEFSDFCKKKYERAKMEPGANLKFVYIFFENQLTQTCYRNRRWSFVRTKYWRTGNSNDAQNVSLCWCCFNEHHTGSS